MEPDRVHLRRLADLDVWPGPTEMEPLAGGITNRNFLVRSGGRAFVARVCAELSILGIDRRNEVVCQRAAHALGVAPGVVHHEAGVLVSEHVPARTLTPHDLCDPAILPRLADLLRVLHGGWDGLAGEMLYFSVFQAVRTYAATARGLGARLPADADALLDDARGLARRVGPFVPVLCHNDLLAANVLDDGARVWLVDWEYAGVGHPLFDLANLTGNARMPDPLERSFLAAYRGTSEPDPRDLAELRVLKAASLLREALWAVIQTVASDLDFDYAAYADDNFRAYRAARAALDGAGG